MPTVIQEPEQGLSGEIDLVEEDGIPVLRLRGEVDSLVVAAWQSTTPGSTSSPVAVDASAATFLDCRGLRLIVHATEGTRRAGRVPELRRPPRSVRRLIELAGAAPLFATVP